MATITGGGATTLLNLGSNETDSVAQTLIATIVNGLKDGTVTRTSGATPSVGGGLLTTTVPNAFVVDQPGVSVNFVAGAFGSATVVGAGGPNEVVLGDNENITYNTGGGSGTLVTGDGNNFIGTPLSGFASSSFNITTGNGNDEIIAGVGTNTISAGAGNNTIFTVNASDVINSSGNDTISGIYSQAGEQDTIYQSTGTVYIGEFAKNLDFVGSNATATVLSGQGSYTINGGAGANLIGGGTAGNNVLGGGTGSVGSTIYGAGSGDLLYGRGSGSNVLVAGAGNETLSGAYSTGTNTFYTAFGANVATANDVIVGGPSQSVYFAGSGHSTIYSGAANDIVAIVNGSAGGSIVLNNFNTSSGQVQLQGYGSGQDANAYATQQNVNGSAVVTLSDNTTITFTGIAHVNQNILG